MVASVTIGFTLDHETTDSYSKLPWYAIRENYMHAVVPYGATPLALAHDTTFVESYGALIDGLVIIGGDFDIDPALYGDDTTHETVMLKPRRTAFEWKIAEYAIAQQMPVLGICGGMQLLAVVLGGSLIQHIPDAIDTPINHEQPNPRHEVGHSVTIAEGSLLHRIVGAREIGVNSAHHQAVRAVPDSVLVNASAPDGIIEGIELPTHPFCLGVEWHPEYHVSPADDAIWQAFVAAADTYRVQK